MHLTANDGTLLILISCTLLACLGIPTAYVIAIIRKSNQPTNETHDEPLEARP